MHRIATPQAPAPGGHYAQAVVAGGFVFVSGQLPLDTSTGVPLEGDIEAQTELALHHLKAILEAAGSSLEHTVKVTLYISDVAFWPQVNAVYARILGQHRPARSVVPCGSLHHGCLVEIEAVAVLP